jgi:hypothetical protein
LVLYCRPTPRLFPDSFVSSTSCRGPDRLRDTVQARSPRFRRAPFERDMAFDPGRASAPCIAAPHILPSHSGESLRPCDVSISRLNPIPHSIAVYASPWLSPSTPQHSLPGGRCSLPGPDFHRLDRASFAWRTTTTISLILARPRRLTCFPSRDGGCESSLHPRIVDSNGHWQINRYRNVTGQQTGIVRSYEVRAMRCRAADITGCLTSCGTLETMARDWSSLMECCSRRDSLSSDTPF